MPFARPKAVSDRVPLVDASPGSGSSGRGTLHRRDGLPRRFGGWVAPCDGLFEAFEDEYAIRAGIEGTASELKRAHGLGQLRIRRLPKVKMKTKLKAVACNITRWVEELTDRSGDGEPRDGRFFALLAGLIRWVKQWMRPIPESRLPTVV